MSIRESTQEMIELVEELLEPGDETTDAALDRLSEAAFTVVTNDYETNYDGDALIQTGWKLHEAAQGRDVWAVTDREQYNIFYIIGSEQEVLDVIRKVKHG